MIIPLGLRLSFGSLKTFLHKHHIMKTYVSFEIPFGAIVLFWLYYVFVLVVSFYSSIQPGRMIADIVLNMLSVVQIMILLLFNIGPLYVDVVRPHEYIWKWHKKCFQLQKKKKKKKLLKTHKKLPFAVHSDML